MKKLFSIMLVLFGVVMLAGCTDNNTEELQTQLAALQTQYDVLIEDYEELSNRYTAEVLLKEQLEVEIYALEDEIYALNELIFDNIITISLSDTYGYYISKTVGYNEDFEGSLFDLLDQVYDVSYYDTEYGKMITGINDVVPTYGSYLAFIKNNEMSMVGVEQADFNDGDVFTFELAWWDTFAQEVYESILLFLDNQVENLVSPTSMNYNVVLGLDLLGVLDQYVSQEDVLNYIDFEVMTTWNEYVKASYLLDAVGIDNSPAISYLNETLNTVPDYGYSSALNALLKYDTTVSNFSSFETTVLEYYGLNSPYDLGVDSGGMAVIALSNYDTVAVNTMITDYLDWIALDQLSTGGFMTEDIVWGDTTYPGTENASSIAQIIMALVSNGVDLNSATYTKDGNTLVSRLIDFQNTDGSFDYLLGDESSDLWFSTPQAFLALVMVHEYLNNGNKSVNPF